MSVSSPLLLVLGLLVTAALTVGVVRAARRRSAALVAAGVALPGGRRSHLGLWLSLCGVALLAVAAAGPSAALPVARSAGTVILAMDLSNSMSANDVLPSRLAAAQQAASAFVDEQPDSVDIGVVGFDEGALATAPPGPDRSAAKAAIANLRISGGTSLAAAILGSLSAITGKTVAVGPLGALPEIGYWGSATIVLFSDGEDTAGATGDAGTIAATTIAQNAGVHIETVGTGTANGATVAVEGYQLHTALDTDTLTAIARATGGSYHPASDAAQLRDVTSTVDLRLTVAQQDVPLAGAFVAVALAALATGALLSGLRTGRLVE